MAAVRVLRVAPGPFVRVRILARASGRVRGLLTHWTRDGSRMCKEGCPSSIHSLPTIWRGYLAVQVWVEEESLWRAAVLEVTEALEQTMRGEVDRGQTWQLARRSARKKISKEPVTGRIEAHGEGASWIEPFDVRPVLASLYHCSPELIVLDVDSPMPDRLMIPDEIVATVELPDEKPVPAGFSALDEFKKKLGQKKNAE